eukprot:3446292-Rhodomonas_salina.1
MCRSAAALRRPIAEMSRLIAEHPRRIWPRGAERGGAPGVLERSTHRVCTSAHRVHVSAHTVRTCVHRMHVRVRRRDQTNGRSSTKKRKKEKEKKKKKDKRGKGGLTFAVGSEVVGVGLGAVHAGGGAPLEEALVVPGSAHRVPVEYRTTHTQPLVVLRTSAVPPTGACLARRRKEW